MDAVSEVLSARADKRDGLSSMLGASAMAHIAVVAMFVFVPAWWFGVEHKVPETVMQISLGGPVGPDKSGLTTLGGRTIQQAVPSEVKRADRAGAATGGEDTRDGRADQDAAASRDAEQG